MIRHLFIVTALVAVSMMANSANGEPIGTVPVRVGGMADLDACLSTGRAKIVRKPGNFLAVRAMPSTQGKQIAKLTADHHFWICDATPSGQWTGVLFGEKPDGEGPEDCGVGTPIAEQRPYRGPCRSGWVLTRYVELISG